MLGNFNLRQHYKVIYSCCVCVYVFSSTGEKVEGNLEGYGTVEFNDGHTYKVRRLEHEASFVTQRLSLGRTGIP